jgi:hypothetical protein
MIIGKLMIEDKVYESSIDNLIRVRCITSYIEEREIEADSDVKLSFWPRGENERGRQMLKHLTKFSLASFLFLLVSASASSGQDKTDFKVGDTIYVNAFSGGCVKATVTQTDPKYSVHILEGAYKDRDTFYNANRISDCPQISQQNKQPPDAAVHQPAMQKPGSLKVGDRVDVYLSGNQEGKNRGTILEINGSQYKVHYDGCSEKEDVWENFTLVHPAATISADAPDIQFLTGKWAMFTSSYPTTVVRGNDIYREYGTGAKSPPLQINGDGTYIWYFDYGKPPVKGRWMPHAKIEGARNGTETVNGIIIRDSKGEAWKVYRRKSTIDNEDHITARTMCSGETIMGTRIR